MITSPLQLTASTASIQCLVASVAAAGVRASVSLPADFYYGYWFSHRRA
ncbi:hypothetical protein RRX38_02575 [Pseudomonas sp. DTU_2021_1001937_2_SI_NGA_ILE_001]|nr:hypothetical protein [Pseudomonas sp. DTU_2021_1001937_2_SI_NGA_ILE_001]WNW10081.1 hypothetical protein RRX38_02575 [Pseudomonas sp. DTU_2021_1001937_2_SI_NGA_ILE_001]